ncbi:MAG: ferritin [Runella sp.]
MKDLMRLKTSLKEELEIALNAQVKMEAESSAKYLAMAAWCDRNGFTNSADFFFTQADEERAHMLKIFKYICDMGGTAITPDVTNVPQEYPSFRSVFEAALEQEIAVSQSINRLVGVSRRHDDYATENFLQWFVKEQIEEEYIARRQVELFDVIGEEGIGRFTIDSEIPKVTYPGAAAEAE